MKTGQLLVWAACAMCATAAARAETEWSVNGGRTVIILDTRLLAGHGVTWAVEHAQATGPVDALAPEGRVELSIDPGSSLTVRADGGMLGGFSAGQIRHEGGLHFTTASGELLLAEFSIRASDGTTGNRFTVTNGSDQEPVPALELLAGKVGFDGIGGGLFIESYELSISAAMAEALGQPELEGEIIGGLTMEVLLAYAGGDDPLLEVDEEIMGADPETQGGTECMRDGPDVIVGDLIDISNYPSLDGIEAYAVGTTSCNVGDEDLLWIAGNNQHPVIGQRLYRLKDGRFEQIGLSWLKHGFTALTQDVCSCGCNGHGGSVLGVGCSDPYCCGLNGQQSNLGPPSEVNAYTGFYPYPWINRGDEGDCGGGCTSTYKRLQVKISDLDPAQDGGGLYFVEGHYVTADDAAASNHFNNASYRRVNVGGGGSAWTLSLTSTTQREQMALKAWQDNDASVVEQEVRIGGEGLFLVAGKATDLGTGFWHYDYAVQNLNSDRSMKSFSIPIGTSAAVENISFHDVNYHSGDPWDGTDWPHTFVGGTLSWSTDDYDVNTNANALRWGTTYNFRFDASAPPVTPTTITLGIFKPGSPTEIFADEMIGPATGPLDCNTNGVDDDQDIAGGTSRDCNGNGVPDECETFLPTPMKSVRIATGLSSPVGIYWTPDPADQRGFIVEQAGRIKIFADGVVQPTLFLNITSIVSSGGERGLLGLAFHPDYNSNGLFYVNYTNLSGNTVIAQYSVSANPDVADPASAVILRTINQDQPNHNGGQLQFGPDGMLYIGMGDGGGGGDPLERAQNPLQLLGKMLRLDVNNSPTYIPADNPFVGDPGTLDEIWALGMRNPWRFSFDRLTDDLYIGDVGQNAHEEIDFQPAASTGGENYGWDCYEGDFSFEPAGCGPAEDYVFPIKDVPHSGGVCSITGGFVYRGCAMPELGGTYFYSDFCADWIKTFRFVDGQVTDEDDVTGVLTPDTGPITSVSSFGEDNQGELYIVSLNGSIYKIVPDIVAPICGNGVLEEGEECDPPDGLTCDDNCLLLGCSVLLLDDDFETDQGWTVESIALTDGPWERAVPRGNCNRGDPPSDFDGSGQCYLTDNSLVSCNSDVDGGPTRVISPVLDLRGNGVTLRYAYWYTNDDNDPNDGLQVEVSTNGGGTWTQIANYLASNEQWFVETLVLNDFVTPSATTQIRFSAMDNPSNSILEAAVDAVLIRRACDDCNSNGVDDADDITFGTSDDANANAIPDECEEICMTAAGDGDGDCDRDLGDFAAFQQCYTGDVGTGAAVYSPGCACFDADGDGDVDGADYAALAAVLEGPDSPADGCITLLSGTDAIRGGLLYDRYWMVNGAGEPVGQHPLYPKTSFQTGSTTFRCKECHGWDYKGADGAYDSGLHFTGIRGVFGSIMSPTQMHATIKVRSSDNGHRFGFYGMSDDDIRDVVAFLDGLVIDTDLYVDGGSAFIGDEVNGETLYGNPPPSQAVGCVNCHGADGTAINFGTPEDPEYLGTHANDNPWEFLHKVRLGNPQAPAMPSVLDLGLTDQDAADIGAHAQTFPTE